MKKVLLASVLCFLVWSQPVIPAPVYSTVVTPASSLACSSFCLDNNGYAVFGTNLDHYDVYEGLVFVNKRNVVKTGWESSTTGTHAAWVSKYGSVTFNLVGYQLVWAGMNEKGLVISTMNLGYATQSPLPDERPPLDSGFWIQYQLDTCSTVEEVIASDSLVRMSNTVDHYLVCDRKGNCAAIEFIGGEMVCHTGDTMPVKALTNHAYRESLRAWQESELYPVTHPSLRRFIIAANRVQHFDPGNSESAVDYAFDTLEQVSGEKVSRSTTFWSIVFDTENFIVYFRTKMSPHIRYIDMGMCDFSCTNPVLMVDINENLSGDVTTDFKEYSRITNLEHITRFCEKWGIDTSPGGLSSFCRHFEKFPCKKDEEYSEKNDPDEFNASPIPTDTEPDDTYMIDLKLICLLIILGGCAAYFICKSRGGHQGSKEENHRKGST